MPATPSATRQRCSMAQPPTPVVLPGEAALRRSSIGGSASCRAQEVVAEQRNERHRDDARGHQRAGEHDRQAVDELPGRRR